MLFSIPTNMQNKKKNELTEYFNAIIENDFDFHKSITLLDIMMNKRNRRTRNTRLKREKDESTTDVKTKKEDEPKTDVKKKNKKAQRIRRKKL